LHCFKRFLLSFSAERIIRVETDIVNNFLQDFALFNQKINKEGVCVYF